MHLAKIIKPYYTLFLSLVIASIIFAVFRLSLLEDQHTPIKVTYGNQTNTATLVSAVSETDGSVIGSKSGKKYYFPWCGTVKRIKLENQVHFSSILEARSKGYLPGGNCKGLK